MQNWNYYYGGEEQNLHISTAIDMLTGGSTFNTLASQHTGLGVVIIRHFCKPTENANSFFYSLRTIAVNKTIVSKIKEKWKWNN